MTRKGRTTWRIFPECANMVKAAQRVLPFQHRQLKSSPFMAILGALQGQKAPRQHKKQRPKLLIVYGFSTNTTSTNLNQEGNTKIHAKHRTEYIKIPSDPPENNAAALPAPPGKTVQPLLPPPSTHVKSYSARQNSTSQRKRSTSIAARVRLHETQEAHPRQAHMPRVGGYVRDKKQKNRPLFRHGVVTI